MPCNILSCAYPCCLGQLRFMVAFMLLAGIIVQYCHRAVLNMAIVEMVGAKSAKKPTCPIPEGQGASTIKKIGGGNVEWSEGEQGLILASFFIGYVIMHVPGGILCDRYGARHFLLWSFIISTTTTAVLPLCAIHLPWWSVFLLRVLTGAAQGVLLPALSSLLSRWIPPNERSTIGGIVFAANAFGLVIGNVCTGLMIKFVEDWRMPFYMWSCVGIVYCVVFIGYVFSDPRTDPFLTEVELDYMAQQMVFKQPMPIPLGKMLADKCIYGLIFAQVGHSLIIFTLANNLPKYMNNVLGFNIQNNALVSFIFLLQWMSGFAFGKLADHLVKKKNANVSWMRKIYTSISNCTSGVFLCLAGLMECKYVLVLSMFALAIFWKGLFFCGMKVNIIDISVNHSALVMSIVNGIGAISGFVCSTLIGKVAKDNSHMQWNIIFVFMLGAQIITSLLYCILASCDRRKWDYLPGEEPPPKKKALKWYLQMTPSDHALRLEKDSKMEEKRKLAAEAAKIKMDEQIKEKKAAKKAAAAAK